MPYRDKDDRIDIEEERGNDIIAGNIMSRIVIFGGPQAGFNTNPETKVRQCFIEENGEKLVCIAQGGECRYNHHYYSPGLSDAKSWRTPIIEKDCPDQCCYKVLVCDNHPDKCEGSITYYPEYNKFAGQFRRYCRNFEKYLKREKQEQKKEKGENRVTKVKGKNRKSRVTWSHY